MPTTMSEVKISNQALFRVGVGKLISSLAETSQQANLCKEIYPAARDYVLTMAPWPFATRQAGPMASISDVTFQGWAYAFTLPDQFLAMQEIWSGYNNPEVSQRIPHHFMNTAAQGTVLVCNSTGIYIRYTVRVTAPELFTQAFCEAVSWKMALDLGMALVVKQQILDRAQAYFDKALLEARAQHINEVQQEMSYDGGEIVRARE